MIQDIFALNILEKLNFLHTFYEILHCSASIMHCICCLYMKPRYRILCAEYQNFILHTPSRFID